MNPGLSIQITWPLAAHEAIAGQFELIEPSHMLMAALKFAELEDQQIDQLVEDSRFAKALLAERNAARALLAERSIGVPQVSQRIRRGLRKQLGAGGRPYDGLRAMHRSSASRAICKKAEETARSVQAREWCIVHLLEALLESPLQDMEKILAAAGIQPPKPGPDRPCLNQYGRDLGALAAAKAGHGDRKQAENTAKDPVCKVLLDYLAGYQDRSILLVQKGGCSPGEIVERLASRIKGCDLPAACKYRRIIEIDLKASGWEIKGDPASAQAKLGQLLEETSRDGEVILFFNHFEEIFPGAKPGADYEDLIKERLAKGMRCLAGTDEGNFRTLIERNREWKKLFHCVWIHDLDAPFEL